MPRPVRELVRLVHIEHIDLSKIKKDDLAVAALLKSKDPELYKSLKKACQGKVSGQYRTPDRITVQAFIGESGRRKGSSYGLSFTASPRRLILIRKCLHPLLPDLCEPRSLRLQGWPRETV